MFQGAYKLSSKWLQDASACKCIYIKLYYVIHIAYISHCYTLIAKKHTCTKLIGIISSAIGSVRGLTLQNVTSPALEMI